MTDLDNNIVSEYQNIQPSLIKWGEMVDGYIMQLLNEKSELKNHIKIPPKFRLKDNVSYLSKAIYRKKGYTNHLEQIEDKVGTRVVLLKSDDVIKVAEILLNSTNWQAKKTKDIFDFIPENAKIFDYQSIHLVCTPPKNSTVFPNTEISQLTCEIQIRTLLQHAFAEVSHDSTYKGVYKNDTEIIRKLAKSMALMEATDDYFCDIFDIMADEKRRFANFLKELITIYKTFVPSFDISSLDAKLTDIIFELLIPINVEIEKINSFAQNKSSDIQSLLINSNSYITKQPVILLIAYYIINKPSQLKENWQLPNNVLENLFTSLGISFDTY